MLAYVVHEMPTNIIATLIFGRIINIDEILLNGLICNVISVSENKPYFGCIGALLSSADIIRTISVDDLLKGF